jgi:uncharacterized membrane protein
MVLLILGLALFLGMHAFTMLREPRAALIGRMGEGGYKGLYTLVSLAGLALIVLGYGAYRASGYIPVWSPPFWLGHLLLILTLPIFVLLAASKSGGMIEATVKHPMLLAVKIWAFSHLIANGDLGSILLFGGFLAWAVMARISLKRRAGVAAPPKPAGFTQRDWIALGLGLVLWFVFARWLHTWLIGVSAWPGR